MARATKVALASPNVVVLPTAAPRQVQQNYNRAARAARAALREEAPWPGEYQHHRQREAMRRAEIIQETARTPEMLLVSMLLQTIDDDARRKIAEGLAPSVVVGDRTALQAFAILQCSRMTVGEQLDLQRAQQQLNEGRR